MPHTPRIRLLGTITLNSFFPHSLLSHSYLQLSPPTSLLPSPYLPYSLLFLFPFQLSNSPSPSYLSYLLTLLSLLPPNSPPPISPTPSYSYSLPNSSLSSIFTSHLYTLLTTPLSQHLFLLFQLSYLLPFYTLPLLSHSYLQLFPPHSPFLPLSLLLPPNSPPITPFPPPISPISSLSSPPSYSYFPSNSPTLPHSPISSTYLSYFLLFLFPFNSSTPSHPPIPIHSSTLPYSLSSLPISTLLLPLPYHSVYPYSNYLTYSPYHFLIYHLSLYVSLSQLPDLLRFYTLHLPLPYLLLITLHLLIPTTSLPFPTLPLSLLCPSLTTLCVLILIPNYLPYHPSLHSGYNSLQLSFKLPIPISDRLSYPYQLQL